MIKIAPPILTKCYDDANSLYRKGASSNVGVAAVLSIRPNLGRIYGGMLAVSSTKENQFAFIKSCGVS